MPSSCSSGLTLLSLGLLAPMKAVLPNVTKKNCSMPGIGVRPSYHLRTLALGRKLSMFAADVVRLERALDLLGDAFEFADVVARAVGSRSRSRDCGCPRAGSSWAAGASSASDDREAGDAEHRQASRSARWRLSSATMLGDVAW